MSRPLKLTPKVAERIVAAVAEGSTIEAAASTADVGRRSIYDWLTRFPHFSHAVVNAQAQAAKRRIAEGCSASARERLEAAKLKLEQMRVTQDWYRAGRSTKELAVQLGRVRTTAWILRHVLGLVDAPTRAAGLRHSDEVLSDARAIVDAYERGFVVPVSDPRHDLAVLLGLETGRAWRKTGKRTGRILSKASVLEVRP